MAHRNVRAEPAVARNQTQLGLRNRLLANYGNHATSSFVASTVSTVRVWQRPGQRQKTHHGDKKTLTVIPDAFTIVNGSLTTCPRSRSGTENPAGHI